MKTKILKEKLNQSVNIVESLTKKNINLPILSNLLIEAEKNFLKLSATNLENSIIWNVLAKTEKEGKICIPASFFKSLVNFIKSEKVSLNSNKGNLILKSQNKEETQIQGVDPNDFPIIPKIEKKNSIEIEGEKIKEALEQIINIPSTSQLRPEISGIYFSFQKNKLYLVATDSFRLAEKVIELKNKAEKDFSFIIPQFTAKELISILSVKMGKIKIYFDSNQVMFEWVGEGDYPEIQFSSKLIEGEYPNYEEIIPKKHLVSLLIEDKDDFQNKIRKAGLFSGRISEVKITFNGDNLEIFSQNTDVGMNKSYLPVKKQEKTKEKEVKTSFNYKFLLDGLNNIKSSEVIFNFNNNEEPASLMPVGDESYNYIIMPIKSN